MKLAVVVLPGAGERMHAGSGARAEHAAAAEILAGSGNDRVTSVSDRHLLRLMSPIDRPISLRRPRSRPLPPPAESARCRDSD